jgi:hypothetical protein
MCLNVIYLAGLFTDGSDDILGKSKKYPKSQQPSQSQFSKCSLCVSFKNNQYQF